MFFLSYAGSDAPAARALAQGLKGANVDVWFAEAPRAMGLGRPFPEQLERKFQDSQALLLLVGRRGVDRWVRFEVDAALARHARDPAYPLVPLLLPEADPLALPPFVARFHALRLQGDITRWGRQEFLEVAKQLDALDILPEQLDLKDGPFPGLESFGEERARFYFGRDRELRDALSRLGHADSSYRRWLAVEGPSGVGKSSFLKAGLVPAIRGGWVERGPMRWWVASMRPGRNPVHQLARALVRAFRWEDTPGSLTQVEQALRLPQGLRDLVSQKLREDEGFLLVVDQLEEAFTLSEGSREIPRHLGELLVAALESDGPLHLLTSLRSDFLGRMGEMPRLAAALNAGWTARYYLPPLNVEELSQVLLGPAHLARLEWEEGLPTRILKDTEAESGGLPLVAHVLRQLWERRHGQKLLHSAYEELGGVAGAITYSADALLATFSPEEQASARKLLLALVKVGRRARDTRRSLTFFEAQQVVGGGEQGHALLLRLSGGRSPQEPVGTPAPPRLLVVGEERVELIHEALLEQWRTLRSLLEEHRRELERSDDLESAARLWERTQELPGEAQLRYLQTAEPVSATARAFLEAVRMQELQRQRATQAWELATFALQVARRDPQLSLRLIFEARRLAPTGQMTDALLTWYLRRQRLCLGSLHAEVNAAVFSPDGQRILTAGEDGLARVWDARNGQLLIEVGGHANPVSAVAFSPDGQRILVGGQNGTARIWDATSGKRLVTLAGHSGAILHALFTPDGQYLLIASKGGTVRLWDAHCGRAVSKLKDNVGQINTIAFSRDGRYVLTTGNQGSAFVREVASRRLLVAFQGDSRTPTIGAFSPDGQRVLIAEWTGHTQIYDVPSGKPLVQMKRQAGLASTITFSQDGRRALIGTSHGMATLWDTTSGEQLANLQMPAEAVLLATLSPESPYLLTGSDNGTAHIREVESAELLAELPGHSEAVVSAIASPSRRYCLTLGYDGMARAWDAALSSLLLTLPKQSARMRDATFHPEGQYLLTNCDDTTARLWEVNSGRLTAELRGYSTFSTDGQRILTIAQGGSAELWDVASGRVVKRLSEKVGWRGAVFSPDGRYVIGLSHKGEPFLWNSDSRKRLTRLDGQVPSLLSVAFSPDSQSLLVGDHAGTVRLWSMDSCQLVFEFVGHVEENRIHTASVTAVAFSPDGKRLLTGGGDRKARLWDASTGQLLAELPGHSDTVHTALFSPDGQRILTKGWEKTPRLWSAMSGRLLAELRGHSEVVHSVTFSPDGQLLMTCSSDGTAHVWNASSGHSQAVLRGHTGSVYEAVFSPSGRLALTASRDHTARIWDTSSGRTVTVLGGHSGPVWTARCSKDGRIVTASGDGTVRIWECDLFLPPEALFARARTYLSHELTEDERRIYLHEAVDGAEQKERG